ncbi:hypothetical protein WDU94_014877 [Cyamophila willieti]
MDEDDLGDLVEVSTSMFEPLRCPHSDDNDEITGMLHQTFRMITMQDSSLVSCCHETCMQWEITDNTVQLVRCVVKPGSSPWLMTNLLSLEDGFHFLTSQMNGTQSKIAVHHIDLHGPLCELIVDHLIVELIPLSLNHFLDPCQSNDLRVYSLKRPAQYLQLNLPNTHYLCMKKLPHMDSVVVILYEHHVDLWNITDQACSLLSHYEFQSVYLAVEMEMIDSRKLIIMSEESGLQAETLLCINNFKVISESPIPDRIEGDLVCPFSNSTVITVTPNTDRMGQYIENYMIHSLVKNKSCKIAVGLYADERYSLFCQMVPNTLDIIVFTTRAKFFKFKINDDLVHLIKYAELRKNARIIAQAHRTLSSHFRFIPVEICLKIIALTDPNLSAEKARRIASLYFCKPSCDS